MYYCLLFRSMKKFSFLAFVLMVTDFVIGQEQWSLASCIDHAIKNNVALQQNSILVDQAALQLKESRYKLLPDLNGTLNSGISFGRNVDPTTNIFTTEDILYSNYSLSSSVVIFQSGLYRNTIKQNKINLQAAQKDYEQARNDLALTIATYYLNVLLSQEKMEIAEKNREIANQQLNQIQKLIQVGMKPEADALEIQAQLARAEQALVFAENALELAWLYLKQSLRIPPETRMILETLSEAQFNDLQLQKYTFEELLLTASANQAGMQAAKLRLDAAKTGEKIARALYYPSVYFGASIGSRYSDAAIGQEVFITKEQLPGALIDDQPAKIEFDGFDFRSTGVIPFNTQFDQFLGYGGNISVSIPIFNNYSTRAGVQRAKLAAKQSELQLELTKEKLGQDIYQAMANVKSAIKELEASKNVFLAAKSSFEKTQKRFDIGMSNVFELNQIQTNYLNAETNYQISKYDLVFKQKVLDYYAGKEIRL